ncbi:phytanoyl-CoA dioxygenase family protein [Oscillatoria sp. CS-180]|uniref:phytanoyl-CoA dioxygenase family protein n=1 Tax=Oscillatoria sp. CS-180 TaxID=3021720 RepID=UPI00232E2E17|nr:phytanoyl-CoA dioxygenase family protein [Oscillatoria sp. CS-180]MDB9527413.1 phytanoyl-CoA dioxygenase family protein [Oscillatoria sp. CS-180]
MLLTPRQIQDYEDTGMLSIPHYFSMAEIERLRSTLPRLMQSESPSRVVETDQKTVRALHGCHLESDMLQRLVTFARLIEPARLLLQGDVYCYQFKINLKAAYTGDVWPWHQDFAFWQHEDDMTHPLAVNAVLFLDDCNDFNGPLYFIPGSHNHSYAHNTAGAADASAAWIANVSAKLKYTLDQKTVTRLVEQHGLVAAKGKAGTALFFHCNLVHGSVPNISPYDRRLIIITYNSVRNAPISLGKNRPSFLVNRDTTPLQPSVEETLVC